MAVSVETRLRWETSIEAAKERAAKEGKPILMDFSAAPT